MIFKVILEIENDIFHGDENYLDDCSDPAVGFFKICYEIDDKSLSEAITILYYFSFTSLSTVGLGDYNPKSNIERIYIAISLLLGVAIFSIIMNNFNEILAHLQTFDEDLDQEDQLSLFFSVL
jgi:hypothetical protein